MLYKELFIGGVLQGAGLMFLFWVLFSPRTRIYRKMELDMDDVTIIIKVRGVSPDPSQLEMLAKRLGNEAKEALKSDLPVSAVYEGPNAR